MVFLDSNHTHDHVYEELKLYSKFVSVGSYCVVFDTLIENLPTESFTEKNWSKGNSPLTAVEKFLKDNSNFEINNKIDNKLMLSVAPSGYLKKLH